MRFGSRGALCVDKIKGTWCDHSDGDQGGGVLDLLHAKKGLEKSDALDWLRERKHLPPAPESKNGRIVATYDYFDADGVLLFQVVRKEPKAFLQRRPNGKGGWIWKTSGMQLALYRLPEVLAAVAAGRPVHVAEGEKGVDALVRLGVTATCSPRGAGKWQSTYSPMLAGADVILLPDKDEPGEKHAGQVSKALNGVARSVRILRLPDLPDKGDVADWIAAGGTRQALEDLAQAITPPPGGTAQPAPIEEPEKTARLDYDAIDAVVERFNKKFMVVNENGKGIILQPGYDPVLKRRRFDRLSVRDLELLYLNDVIRVGEDAKGNPIYKPVAGIWLKHKGRRQYIGGVTFDPAAKAVDPDVLNLWEGFAVKPKPGDWSLLRAHLQSIICDSDSESFSYAIGWMARMVQHPAEQGEVAFVMKGKEGCGKGTLAKVLKRIMGHHGLAVSHSKHLIGNFNGHLRDCVFLFADEALFAGDKSHVGVLKSLITEPYLTIESKFSNAVQMPNFLHVMMASNEEWIVPASLEARRFFVREVPDTVVGHHDYFAAIWKQMESGGYEAMLHDLLEYDLTTFNVRAVPQTEGLQNQRRLSLGTTESWWLDCLERGYVFRSRLGLDEVFSTWMPNISTELLVHSYLEFAKSRGERRPLSREHLGQFFSRTLKADCIRLRNAIAGEATVDVENMYGGTNRKAKAVLHPRPPGYVIGDLHQARGNFVHQTGLSIQWDGGARDDTPVCSSKAATNADDPFGEMEAAD